MKIVWRARARADMQAIVDYIARDKPAAAFRTHDRITNAVGWLADWPDLGRQGRRKNIRELVVPRTPYLVIYRRARGEVIVQRVLHGRQNR